MSRKYTDEEFLYAVEHGRPGDSLEQALNREAADRRIVEMFDQIGKAERHSGNLTEVDLMIAGAMDGTTNSAEFRRVRAQAEGRTPQGGRGMEHAEVRMAEESLTDAYLKAHPSATLQDAQHIARHLREDYQRDHRAEHSTERALLEATATHLTAMAAYYRQPRKPTPARESSSRPGTRVVRIRESMGHINPVN